MTIEKELNDPEYRWYHKEELSKIMPRRSERTRLGIKILDYDKLRNKNASKIKECKDRKFKWESLKSLIETVPYNANTLPNKKKNLDNRDRLHFESRDMGECFVCGQINRYGSNNVYSLYTYNGSGLSHLHHILPNGDASDKNIVTVCVHCHKVIHELLYLTGRWKYSKPM